MFADLDDDGDWTWSSICKTSVVAFNDLPTGGSPSVTVRVRERKGAMARWWVLDAKADARQPGTEWGESWEAGCAAGLAHVPRRRQFVALSNGQGAQSRLPKAAKAGHQAVVFSGEQFK